MNIKNIALIAALAIGSTVVAKADIMSINGSDVYDTTAQTITFDNPANVGGTSTGIFAGLIPCTGCINMVPSLNYGSFSGPVELFEGTDNGITVSLTLETLAFTDDLTLTGNAQVDINGVLTDGTYELTTQGGGDGVSDVTFSETTKVSATPEPASLALFGTGLLGVVGIARRKFSV
jgi:hypothetical protein